MLYSSTYETATRNKNTIFQNIMATITKLCCNYTTKNVSLDSKKQSSTKENTKQNKTTVSNQTIDLRKK
jgi:hypothetical protein